MDVISFLMTPPIAPFAGVLSVVLVIFVLEVTLTLLAGTGFSDLVGALVSPDSLPDTSFMNWLLVREIPMLMAILAFITGFGASGLLVQLGALQFFDLTVPMGVAYTIAVVSGVGSIRAIAMAIKKLRIVHSTALPAAAFLGQVATLTSPTAQKGYSGSASFTDHHGYTHYVMVEPATDEESFAQGDKVVLEARLSDSLFQGRRA